MGLVLLSCGSSSSARTGAGETGGGPEAVEEDWEPDFVRSFGEGAELPVTTLPEVWTYVIAGQEAAYRSGLPISDIAYFGAGFDDYGSLVGVPRRQAIRGFSGRVHLTVADKSRPQTHFLLVPESPQRRDMVASLLQAASGFDGLQLDFENIPAKDGGNFLSLLRELRAGLGPGKMLTVALYARTRALDGDVHDYLKIAPLVDRIVVMAYDEHWSGSSPGPISSLGWGKRVAEYALRTIGREKLVMGLPFYGRAWADVGHSRAYVYEGIRRVARENGVTDIRRENGIPTFKYGAKINVTVYFEDEHSLALRMDMYRSLGVRAIGFWRLGQETPAMWKYLKLGG